MAIAKVHETEVDNVAGAASNNITIPATTAGNLLVAFVSEAAGSTAVSATFSSAGTTWVNPSGTAATDGPPPIDFATGTNSWIAVGYALNVPGGVTTVTVTWGATSKANSVSITEWSGVATSAAVDAQKHGGGGVATTPQTATSLTTLGSADLVMFAISSPVSEAFASGTATPTTGWTALTNGTSSAFAWNIGAAGTYAGSWSLTANKAGMIGIAFLAAAAAITPVVNNYDQTDDLSEV